MKRMAWGAVILLPLGIGGCMGAGLLARNGANTLFGGKDKPPAERIATAQEKAISEIHGGTPGTPIAWSDEKSGLQGTLMPTATGDVPAGCRGYQQTVILAGETLRGHVVACAQASGAWQLSSAQAQGHP